MLGGEEWRRPQLLLQVEAYLPTEGLATCLQWSCFTWLASQLSCLHGDW